jgi:hypothetical protein
MKATQFIGEEPPLPGAKINRGVMEVLLACAKNKKGTSPAEDEDNVPVDELKTDTRHHKAPAGSDDLK